MDDLARIERVYGCVAEYNRCMEEENQYEPTEEEIAESEKQYAEYTAKIKELDGVESQLIRDLVAKWEITKPDRDDIYGGYEWSRKRKLDIIEQLRLYYGVEVNEDWETFYRPPEGKWAISVEYNDGIHLKNKHIGNLSFEQFKAIYRDLWYARLWPTMKYGDRILSNCSLGRILYEKEVWKW